MSKKTVVLGILGTRLDSANPTKRWNQWRPSVAVCQQDDFHVDRYDLLYPASHTRLINVVRDDVESVSPDTDVHTHEVNFTDPWDFEEVFGTLHDFARGYRFNTDRNDYLIHITTGSHVQQICLFLLTESRHLPGVLLQTGPPRRRSNPDCMGTRSIIDLDLSRYDPLAARFARERHEAQEVLKSGIDTRNSAFNRLIERIERVAISSKAPILLTGPTGAGKTRLARKIYDLKRMREQLGGRFVEVNCATLRGDHAMSTLFGHVKGAFTGAATARDGLLKTAQGGTLFLDEIGELGLDEQAMLLRAIEEKAFLPVGADKESTVNFQLIAGTNRDLQQHVGAGRFREDLLARINLWSFPLPGLASRREDIEPNLDFEIDRASSDCGHRITMTREARRKFLDWATSPAATWNGNFRDLAAAVLRMATLAPDGRIGTAEANEEIERLKESWNSSSDVTDATLNRVFDASRLNAIDPFDQAQLSYVLRICRTEPSMAAAGRRLFSVSRLSKSSSNDSDRLRKFLARFGLDWSAVR